MNARETILEKLAVTVGSCMLFFGILTLGPLGFLLLLGLFYAMLTQNFALGFMVGALLCAPAVFGIMWAGLAWPAVLGERMAPAPETATVAVIRTDV